MTQVQSIIDTICVSGPIGFQIHSPNEIADFFRQGETLLTLAPMLTHSNPEILSAGSWIASEVVDSCHGREIYDELSQLLHHPDPAVRFWPISCVAQLSTFSDTASMHKLVLLIADENVGVRKQALRYLCNIPDSTLAGIENTPIRSIMRLLSSSASKVDILTEAQSKDDLQRRSAIAGTIRNFRTDSEFVDELSRLLDGEERDEVAQYL